MAAQLCEAQGKASLGSSVKTFFFPFAKEIAKLAKSFLREHFDNHETWFPLGIYLISSFVCLKYISWKCIFIDFWQHLCISSDICWGSAIVRVTARAAGAECGSEWLPGSVSPVQAASAQLDPGHRTSGASETPGHSDRGHGHSEEAEWGCQWHHDLTQALRGPALICSECQHNGCSRVKVTRYRGQESYLHSR